MNMSMGETAAAEFLKIMKRARDKAVEDAKAISDAIEQQRQAALIKMIDAQLAFDRDYYDADDVTADALLDDRDSAYQDAINHDVLSDFNAMYRDAMQQAREIEQADFRQQKAAFEAAEQKNIDDAKARERAAVTESDSASFDDATNDFDDAAEAVRAEREALADYDERAAEAERQRVKNDDEEEQEEEEERRWFDRTFHEHHYTAEEMQSRLPDGIILDDLTYYANGEPVAYDNGSSLSFGDNKPSHISQIDAVAKLSAAKFPEGFGTRTPHQENAVRMAWAAQEHGTRLCDIEVQGQPWPQEAVDQLNDNIREVRTMWHEVQQNLDQLKNCDNKFLSGKAAGFSLEPDPANPKFSSDLERWHEWSSKACEQIDPQNQYSNTITPTDPNADMTGQGLDAAAEGPDMGAGAGGPAVEIAPPVAG